MQLGPNLGQLGPPKASNREAKSGPRRSKNGGEKRSEVEIAFRSEKRMQVDSRQAVPRPLGE